MPKLKAKADLDYGCQGQFDCAIKDCTRAIDFNSDYADAYHRSLKEFKNIKCGLNSRY